jgi:hypothetical protein
MGGVKGGVERWRVVEGDRRAMMIDVNLLCSVCQRRWCGSLLLLHHLAT